MYCDTQGWWYLTEKCKPDWKIAISSSISLAVSVIKRNYLQIKMVKNLNQWLKSIEFKKWNQLQSDTL